MIGPRPATMASARWAYVHSRFARSIPVGVDNGGRSGLSWASHDSEAVLGLLGGLKRGPGRWVTDWYRRVKNPQRDRSWRGSQPGEGIWAR